MNGMETRMDLDCGGWYFACPRSGQSRAPSLTPPISGDLRLSVTTTQGTHDPDHA